MHSSLRLMLILIFVSVKAQDPRKRLFNSLPAHTLDEAELNGNDDEDFPCSMHACIKRSSGQDELGPFWANRGKKDPSYTQERLFAEEPRWLVVRKDEGFQDEPFFMSRGKKEEGRKYANNNIRLRDRREFQADVESPFFAARGRRFKQKNYKL